VQNFSGGAVTKKIGEYPEKYHGIHSMKTKLSPFAMMLLKFHENLSINTEFITGHTYTYTYKRTCRL
jgi:hypothetical protein